MFYFFEIDIKVIFFQMCSLGFYLYLIKLFWLYFFFLMFF